ncbi:MarR family winged helix-turn-helix transcriptional regulator [Calditerricola satsumensis]|uniref:Putative HTH-type transcriptional regulator YsmB n=1 Tax=Calditerricola satsumensis TaxID=373054 RepID=A0A8J3B782_9BACI|nr:MarR family transcriptional regulator [Calditerricola satsumensis]GGK00799.1 putative HTH-type transcriptional regulator YsmB [Calditerricola satsumensis]
MSGRFRHDCEDVYEIERLLRHMSCIVKQKGREILNHFPITPPQFDALLWLDECGDLTISELSNRMYLACSTITDLVDRMEKNGLVERVRDQSDRRVVRIRLLDKGRQIIQEVLKRRREYLAEVLAHVPPDDVREIRRALTRLNETMEKCAGT